MNSRDLKGQRETTSSSSSSSSRGKRAAVKLEIVEDPLEEKYGPLHKQSKASQTIQQWGAGANAVPVSAAEYNPLDEPSPLGLQLRKSPSLLDLIQMRLTQGNNASALGTQETEKQNLDVKKESKSAPASGSMDKLKASNFPASILRIGSWEYKSRYEGDLVAKCYFAKHKLVWEVLEGGLKSKIEIQWSDIMALKANCPDNEPATLNVVLARQPLFFRETNPQPRKHTLWQATADFTDGQASIHKQHFLQCPEGLLNKHFEKLIQCDMRLNFLSRQPEIILDSPYFEQRPSVFEDLDDSKSQDFNQVESAKVSVVSGFQDLASPSAAQSSSLEIEKGDPTASTSDPMSREAPSPSSVMDSRAQHKFVQVQRLKLHVAEIGAGPKVVVFLHGFPEIWYSWRHQMICLANAGFRAIAPDYRGYGLSDPPPVPAKTMFGDLISDLLAILDFLEINKVVLVAKDFGAKPAYLFALLHPERVLGVVTLGVPFIPPGPGPSQYQKHLPEGFYISRWQKPGRAEADFGRLDAKTVVRNIYILFSRSEIPIAAENQEIMDLVDLSTPLPPWFTEEDLATYGALYEKSGFQTALQVPYRSLYEDINITEPVVEVPALLIMGDKDYVFKFPGMEAYIKSGKVKEFVPGLDIIYLPEGSHFVQEQSPDEVNQLILTFLNARIWS